MHLFFKVHDFRKRWIACCLQRPFESGRELWVPIFGFATLCLLGIASTSIAGLWGRFFIRSGGGEFVPEFVSNSLGIFMWRIKAFLDRSSSCIVVN